MQFILALEDIDWVNTDKTQNQTFSSLSKTNDIIWTGGLTTEDCESKQASRAAWQCKQGPL